MYFRLIAKETEELLVFEVVSELNSTAICCGFVAIGDPNKSEVPRNLRLPTARTNCE
jgi:hypothetical protein